MADKPPPFWFVAFAVAVGAGGVWAFLRPSGPSRRPAGEEAPRPQMARQLPGDGPDGLAMPAYFKDVRTGLCFATMDPELRSLRDAILVPCDKVVGR